MALDTPCVKSTLGGKETSLLVPKKSSSVKRIDVSYPNRRGIFYLTALKSSLLSTQVKRHEARWLEQWEKQDAPSLTSSKPAKSQGRPQSAAVRSTVAVVSESARSVSLRQSAARKEETATVRGVIKSPEKGGVRQSRAERGVGVRVSEGEGARTGEAGVNGFQERGVNGAQGRCENRDHTAGVKRASVNGIQSGGVNGCGVNEPQEESAKRYERRGALLDGDDVDALLDEGRKARNGVFALESIDQGGSRTALDSEESAALHVNERRVKHLEESKGEPWLQEFGTGRSTWQDRGADDVTDASTAGSAASYRVSGGVSRGLGSGSAVHGGKAYVKREGEMESVSGRAFEVEEASNRGRDGAAERRLEAGLNEGLEDPGEENGAEEEEGDGELLEEITGAAGKVERVYASGKRVVIFGNGTKKEV